MSTAEIKQMIDQVGTTFKEYRDTNDARIKALEKGDTARAAELGETLAKMDSELSKLGAVKTRIEKEMELMGERVEELEAKGTGPGRTETERNKDEYKNAFVTWMRGKGQDSIAEQKMQSLGKKEVTIGSSVGGGYAVPEEISREIIAQARLMSPVRDLVRVVPVGTSDYKELVSIGGVTSGWVGESTARAPTATSDLRERAPSFGELYAYPQASEWSLDDVFFNVEQWLAEDVGLEFAIALGNAVISGDGSNKPTGMLNTAPVSTADTDSPVRAAAAYQYVQSLYSPAAIGADELITLVYALNARYRANATFVMNSTTAGVVRKLKDSNNQYLWAPGLQAGEPDRLLGYPHATWEQLDDVGSGAFPIGFGDFKQGYTLADRVGMRITRDNVTNIGFVRFYIRQRIGGTVRDNNAIKWLATIENDV